MNKRIKELYNKVVGDDKLNFDSYLAEKFAEMIIGECTQVLFDESERIFGLFEEETNMQQADEYEMCSDQCIDNIALIEKHFGVE